MHAEHRRLTPTLERLRNVADQIDTLAPPQLREVLYGIFVIAIFLGFRHGVVHAVVTLFNRLVAFRRGKPTLEPSRD